MKPAPLRLPFVEGKRVTLLYDRVLYVPSVGDVGDFTFPGWSDPSLFGNSNPVHLEYCSGNGAWIAAKAAAHPEINWVAVEKKFMRVRKIWSKIKTQELKNLIVISGEGFRATQSYIPSKTISQVFMNFPDPWPKTRHAKHRIIQSTFLEEMKRILVADGLITFVTDDVPYSEWTLEIFGKNRDFTPVFPPPFYKADYEGYGTSYFEDLWREQGKCIRYHLYTKKG